MKSKRATTMADIARLANVSKPTVSRALHDSPLVTDKTKRHVLAVAQKHGYVVNRNAQKLRRARTDTIAVVLDFKSHRQGRISDPFIFDLLAGVSEALGQRNQDLLLCSPGHSGTRSLRAIVGSKGADGVIFLGQGARGDELFELAGAGVPMVVWGAVREGLPYCAVGSDNLLGGRLAGDYLLGLGRRRFLFVGDTEHWEIQLRRRGLSEAIAAAGWPVVVDDLVLDDFSYATSYDAALALVRTQGGHPESFPPDAVFACSDTAAMAFINAFREAGLTVGEAVSVVGYNDIPLAAHFNPPITTIHQDVHTAGALLVDKLMAVIEGEQPPSVTLDTRLIIRQS